MRLLLAFLLIAGTAPAAVQSYIGSFAARTTTGSQAITGVGCQPAVVFLFHTGTLTADGSAANAFLGFGIINRQTSGSLTDFAGSATSLDNLGTSDANTSPSTTQAISVISTTGALSQVAAADTTSIDADGFTLNWTSVDGIARIINFLAVCDPDMSLHKNVFTGVGPGNQSVTGVGFQPELLLTYWRGQVTPQSFFALSFGAATASSSWATIGGSVGGVGTSNTSHYQRTGKAFVLYNASTLAVTNQFTLVSMDADGFTVNWDVGPDPGLEVSFLAIASSTGSYKVGSFNGATSTGEQSVSGVGFAPSSMLMMSEGAASSTSVGDNNRMSVGAAVSTTQRFAQAHGDRDNVDVTNASSYLQRDQAIAFITENGGSPTVDAEADFSCFSSDGATFNWGTADATAREILYLAFSGGTNGCVSPFVRHRVTQE